MDTLKLYLKTDSSNASGVLQLVHEDVISRDEARKLIGDGRGVDDVRGGS